MPKYVVYKEENESKTFTDKKKAVKYADKAFKSEDLTLVEVINEGTKAIVYRRNYA